MFGQPVTSANATFVKADTTTLGSWKGTYGADGYNVIGDTVSYPSYVTATASGNLAYTWAASSTNPRALQKVNSTTDRIMAGWYTPGAMSIDLNFKDANSHQVALYFADWDGWGGGRVERVDILDANNTQLDTRPMAGFAGGIYLVWNFTGHVVIRITNTNTVSNALLVGLLFGPGGANNSPPSTNPIPTISSLAPANATAGTAAFTLTVNGTGFLSSSVVQWNGASRATTFVSATQVQAAITGADIAAAGTGQLTVINPSPGGGTSGNTAFSITASNPVPTISSLAPASATAGSAAFTLTVNGTGFLNGSAVRWNGASRTTTFVSATQVQAAITGADIAAAGTGQLTVFNPSPGGGTSGNTAFSITASNPVPAISSLAPASATAGTAAFTLTVNGTGFLSSSVVNWKGASRTTTFVSATQVQAAITGADIAAAGTGQLTVFNPSPGGGTSGNTAFSITASNPVPTISSLAPASATAGTAAFTLTVNGTGFLSSSVVNWNGASRTTTFVSATQVQAAITGADIAAAGTGQLTVFNPSPGGGTSGNTAFSITASNPVPAISSLAPASATAGTAAFTLTVNGTGFLSSSVVNWNGASRTTTFVSATQVQAAITAADIAAAGTGQVTAFNPSPGGGTSGNTAFSITASNPVPTISSLAPASATAGSAAFTLTVNGTGFLNGSAVRWNGVSRTTTFVSATQVQAAITAADITTAATGQVSVFNPSPGGGTSGNTAFSITASNPVPAISSLAPASATAGTAAFTLTVNGTGFLSSSVVNWNGASRTTTFVSATQVQAAITAADIAAAGTGQVTAFNPSPGGGTSGNTAFSITASNPVPTISSLAPASATAGSAAFTLTVNGTGFLNGSAVRWNGVSRTTTFVSATQVQAAITAADVAAASTGQVTVFNPSPGGGTSGNTAFSITASNPAPTISSLAPASATAGTAAFTLTVNGTGFLNGSVVNWNGASRTTTFVSATQVQAAITAADVAAASTGQVTVFNPSPGGGTSGNTAFSITVSNPVPTISSLAPASATAGTAAFTLTVNGTGFLNGSAVRWNGASRTTTLVSATQVQAAITAADVAAASTGQVTVFNPSPGGGTSGNTAFSITASNPVPAISSLAPASATAGTAAFTLTVNGTGFLSSSVVNWNGASRTTTFVSATQVQAAITAADVAAASTGQVTVFNPSPGGGTSGNTAFSITASNPVPTISSLVPASATAGSAAFTLTVNGTGFLSSSVVQWNGASRTTTFVSATQVQAAITAADITTAATGQVSVFNPSPGGGTSGNTAFSITASNPVPTISSLAPASATAGSAAFTLTVNGTGFLNGSAVRWNGVSRTTTFVSATQVQAAITAADITTAATGQVSVFNPSPGGGTSGNTAFSITASNPVPAISSLAPASATAGTAAFTLTVNGTGFLSSSVVNWNGASRTTTFVSATQVQAAITAADIAAAGTGQVTAFNPSPGGGTSGNTAFSITASNPVPTISSLVPASATVGTTAFTLTVNGTGFLNGSVVNWNGASRTTAFVSATQVQAAITAADVAAASTGQVTVFNPSPGGGTSGNTAFSITASNPVPTISSLVPASATVGTTAFTLTVNGTGFLNGSVVNWNGASRATTFVSATQVQAAITAADVAAASTGQVTVFNPSPGGGTSGNTAFSITASNPVPTISSLAPASATAGTAAFTLTVNGTGFLSSSVVNWNGASRTTTFVSATQVQAAITAADVAAASTGQVTVFNPSPGGGTSGNTAFSITASNPVPTISSLAPASATAGTAAFTLTVNGTGFLSSSVVNWNGASRTTTFVSATQVQAAITAADVAAASTGQVTVFNPSPGGGTSGNTAFSITASNPVPAISSLVPASATVGTTAFTLTVNGTGFLNGSVVRWNGASRTTTFVSATQVQAAITAADVAAAGTGQVTVFNPSPGGGASGNTAFSITPSSPPPSLAPVSVMPSSGTGSSQTFSFVFSDPKGASAISSVSVVFNATLAAGGSCYLLYYPASKALYLANDSASGWLNPVFISQSGTVLNGQCSVNATASSASAIGNDLTLNLVLSFQSSFQGTKNIYMEVYDVIDSGWSQKGTFTITASNPVPTISSLAPASATVGTTAFTLTVNGTGFLNGSVVRWNGASRTTTFVSATQVQAAITAADVAAAGTGQVTVFNPSPGGGASGNTAFSITPSSPPPSLAPVSVMPSSGTGSSQTFSFVFSDPKGASAISSVSVVFNATLAAGGSCYLLYYPASKALYLANDSASGWLNPVFISQSGTVLNGQCSVNATASSASAIGNDLTLNLVLSFQSSFQGTKNIYMEVYDVIDSGWSQKGTFTITASNPVPTISSLAPASATVGTTAFTLTVNGTGFLNGSVVAWNGTSRTTTLVSATQVQAAIPSEDIAAAGTVQVKVFNPAPGGGTSGNTVFTISAANPVATISSLAPANATAGAAAFTLTVNGAGFINGSVVAWNGTSRTTTLVSATQVQAAIPSEDIAAAGTVQVKVFNPAPGGGTSGNTTFTISAANPVPTISSLAPANATAGAAAFTLTVNGAGFINGSVVRWNGASRTTTFMSATQVQAAITAADIAAAGSGQVSVFNLAPEGGTSGNTAFTINPSSPPTNSATFVKTDTITLGGWKGTYGADGYNVIGDTVSYPSYVTATASGNLAYTWAASSTDPRALQKVNSTTDRIMAGWYTPGAMSIDLNFKDANSHQVALYFADWDGWGGGRVERVDILDANNTQLDTRPMAGFAGGIYLVWNFTGHVVIRITNTNTVSNALLVGLLFGPGGANNSPPSTNPIPTISSLAPANATAGTAAFTLTVNGTGFLSSSVVQWNGANRTTTFVSATQVQAAITSADIAAAGTGQVTVFNPSPGGGASGNTAFNITTTTNPIPTISYLAPASATAGSAAFTLTVNGTGFLNGSAVRWNGATRATTFVSPTRIQTAITATDIAAAGIGQVTVVSPAPGGAESGSSGFTITSSSPPPRSVPAGTVYLPGNTYRTRIVSPGCTFTTPTVCTVVDASQLAVNDVVSVNGVASSAPNHVSSVKGLLKIKAISGNQITFKTLAGADLAANGTWETGANVTEGWPAGVQSVRKMAPFSTVAGPKGVLDGWTGPITRSWATGTHNGLTSLIVTNNVATVTYTYNHALSSNNKVTVWNTSNPTFTPTGGREFTITVISPTTFTFPVQVANGDYTHNDTCGPGTAPNGTIQGKDNCVRISSRATSANPYWVSIQSFTASPATLPFDGRGAEQSQYGVFTALRFFVDQKAQAYLDYASKFLKQLEMFGGNNFPANEAAADGGNYTLSAQVSNQMMNVGEIYSLVSGYLTPTQRQTFLDKAINDISDPVPCTKVLPAPIAVNTGTVAAADFTHITLGAGASSTNGFYVNNTVEAVIGGTHSVGLITAYNGTTKQATVTAWDSGVPTNAWTYSVWESFSASASTRNASVTLTGYNTHWKTPGAADELHVGDFLFSVSHWNVFLDPAGTGGIVTAISDDTHVTVFSGYFGISTTPSTGWITYPWTKGDCGLQWLQNFWNATFGSQPSQYPPRGGSNAGASLGDNIAADLDAYLISFYFSVVDDDPRAVDNLARFAVQGIDDNLGLFMSYMGLFFSGESYGPGRATQGAYGIAWPLSKSVVGYPSLDTSGAWITGFQEWKQFGLYPDTYNYPRTGNTFNLFPMQYTMAMDYGIAFDPTTLASQYTQYWLDNVVKLNNSSSVGNSGLADIAVRMDPNAPSLDYKVQPLQYFLNATSRDAASQLGSNDPSTWRGSAVMSRTGWTNTCDTHVWFGSLTFVGDHAGQVQPGDLQVYKCGMFLANDQLAPGDISTPGGETGPYLEFGGFPNYRGSYLPGNGPAVVHTTRWSGPQPYGDPNSNYVCWLTDLAGAYTTPMTRAWRYVCHFKSKGDDELIVSYTDVVSPTPVQIRDQLYYVQNGETGSPTMIYPEGTTSYPGAGGCASLNTNRTVLSQQDGLTSAPISGNLQVAMLPGTAPAARQYNLITRFLSPGTVTVNCDGTIYPGATGHAERVSIYGGDLVRGAATALQSVVVHKVTTQPDTKLNASLLSAGANWVAVQASNSVVLFASDGLTHNSVSVVTTYPGTGQVVVTSLDPGSYSVNKDGVPVSGSPFIVPSGDNSLRFSASSGAITVDLLTGAH